MHTDTSNECVEFRALEYRRDTTLGTARYRFEGSAATGWRVTRNGENHLALGPGYRLLRSERCGVCATDLDRHHLPFALPQITGHEVVACDASGARFAVEINASHASRGVASECPSCRHGLSKHCPARLVLGIHALPGGFGPWVLAPVDGAVALPATLGDDCAVLLEPFAAALEAVTTIDARRGDTIAVLGPRRLGMLVVAALAAQRRTRALDCRILALARRAPLLDLARRLGADEAHLVCDNGDSLSSGLADVVIDTTGSPSALALAARLARRELHLKSTHGRPAAGLERVTQMVVDEIALARLPGSPGEGDAALRAAAPRAGRTPVVCWLADRDPPPWLRHAAELHRVGDAAGALAHVTGSTRPGELPRADVAVVDSPAQVDAVIRPHPESHAALVRPGGEIWLAATDARAARSSPLLAAVAERGLRVTSSRCGDFARALALLEGDPELAQAVAGLVTHRVGAHDLGRALALARSPDALKVVVEHASCA